MQTEKGWGAPASCRSRGGFDYYVNGRSLCGKRERVAGAFPLEDFDDDHPDNCADCKKRLGAHRESERRVERAASA
jgi:hypothetical protein